MSVAVRSSTRLQISLRLEEDLKGGDRQGIGTILGFASAADERKAIQMTTKSLRRTFSADMSSNKWLTQHMPGALKKTASSQEFSEMSVTDSSSGSEGEDEREELRKEAERPGQSDIWSMIQSQKPNSNSPLPPPYVHPLLKKSSSSLCKKSLEICTESLGSETGSDSFSPPPESRRSDYITSDSSDEDTEEEHAPIAVEPRTEKKESAEANYRLLTTTSRKSPPRSFPPPLPSISRHDGPRLRMKPHRKDGRLVVEAISIPCQNNFLADRQDGRLVLCFVNTPAAAATTTTTEAKQSATKEEEEGEKKKEGKVIIEDEAVEEMDKVTIKKEIVLEVRIVQEEVAAAVMKVHRPTLVMSKIVSEVVQLEEREALKRVPRAVPCTGATGAAASFSGYSRGSLLDDSHAQSGPGKLVAKKKPVMVMKPEEILPMMMRCVELSRPVLLWGPRCIATT